MTPTTPADVLQRLVAIFPAFSTYWRSEDSFRADDGAFTFCGVFSTFTWYFRDSFEQLSVAALREVGQFLEECMVEPNSEIDTAAATCFLENVHGEPMAPVLKVFLTGNALQYFEQLDPPIDPPKRKKRNRNHE